MDFLEKILDSGLSPEMYQYYKGLESNRIIINDEINESLVEYAVLPLLQMDEDENVKHIDIVLNTPGGQIYDGFVLVDVLERITTPTTITVMGMAASMGCLILMVKNPVVKKVCYPFSVGLIHSGSKYLSGSAHSVRDTFKFSEKYEQKIKEYILSHTNIDEQMYEEIERQEFWCDADTMLELGIVDEIL